MKILAHICCGPCALFCFPHIREKFDEVIGLWYNPNIHPYAEYQKRLESVKEWAKETDTKVILEDKYELESFLRQVVYRESSRCRICYYLRLRKTAIFALRGNFDYFTSTFLVSPHQNQNLIIDVAKAVGEEYKIKPYFVNLKEGWRESRERSKKMGLYHQSYCGCIYSEKERYEDIKNMK